MKSWIAISATLLLSLNGLAKKLEYAPVTSLQSDTDMSSLEMICTGDKPFETMSCEFMQKSIRTNQSTATENIKKWANLSEKDKKRQVEELKKSCKEFKKNGMPKQTVLSIENYLKDSVLIFDSACKCINGTNQNECMTKIITENDSLMVKTCRFAVNNFTVDFKKISDNKWMNTPEPHGSCKVVNAITLEFDGDYKWKYTQTRLSADKGPLCAFEVNKPSIYASGEMTHKVDCQYIDLNITL